MDHDVVRRVQLLTLKLLGDDRGGPVGFVPDDTATTVLARELPPFIVERVAVAVPRRIVERRHAPVFFDPAHLHVVRNVAPNQVSSDAVPCGPLRPQRAEVESPDDRVADDVATEARIERDDVGIRILERILPRPVAGRRNRRDRSLRRRRLSCDRRDGGGAENRQKRASTELVRVSSISYGHRVLLNAVQSQPRLQTSDFSLQTSKFPISTPRRSTRGRPSRIPPPLSDTLVWRHDR